MLNLCLFSLICFAFCVLLYIIYGITYKAYNKEKARPFECGFDPRLSRLHFCIKFFLLGILFLIFDVEIALILPLPYRPYVLGFIVLLFVGLVYEWYYGGLNWLYVNGGDSRRYWLHLHRRVAFTLAYNRSQSDILYALYFFELKF